MPIDKFQRKQKNFYMHEMFPSIKGLCACGCDGKLTGRQTRWCDPDHAKTVYQDFAVIKGDIQIIRSKLFKEQAGFCQHCGVFDDNWEADHIIEVRHGGGGCDMSNFQTLCPGCHKKKTASNY